MFGYFVGRVKFIVLGNEVDFGVNLLWLSRGYDFGVRIALFGWFG